MALGDRGGRLDAEDVTGVEDDPDAGDDTTRKLKDGAGSDPMSEQTEPDRSTSHDDDDDSRSRRRMKDRQAQTSGGSSSTNDQERDTSSSGSPSNDSDSSSSSRSRREMKDRQAEESAPESDDSDKSSKVEDTFEGGDMNQSGDPSQQTTDTGDAGLENTPAKRTAERTDRTPQTGPTGPEADEGLENTGEAMPEPKGETFDPTDPSSPGGTAVTEAEIRQALAEGKTITNIEDKPAVASQIEKMGGTDVRQYDIGPATDVDLGPDGFNVRTSEREAARQLEERATQQSDYSKGDVAVVGSLAEGLRTTATQEAQKEQRANRASALADAAEGPPEELQRGFQSEEELLVNVGDTKRKLTSKSKRTLNEAQSARESPQPSEEQLGDIDWSFGLGGPEDEVEQALSGSSQKIQSAGQTLASGIFDKGGFGSESAGQEILEAAGRDDLGRQYEEGLRNLGKGTAQGAAFLADVPGLAHSVLEGVETVNYIRKQPGPRSREAKVMAGQAISSATQFAKKNPAKTSGLAIGSLAGSYGIMKAGGKIGPRTGAATRYAIQPGEEIAGELGYRATSKVASTKRADQLFPHKEPLIFSEEAAIHTAKRTVPKLKAAGSRARMEAKSARFAARESLSGDVPTRAGPSGVARRARMEAKSARFKLAEMRADMGGTIDTDTGRLGSAKQKAQSFAGDERGQAQLGKQQSPLDAGKSDLDTDFARNFEEGGTAPRLQSEMESDLQSEPRTELETEQATKSELQSGTRARFEPAFGRIDQAQEPAVDVMAEPEIMSGARSEIATEIAESELAQESRLELETKARSDVEPRQEFRLETELEMEFEQETETELELEFELEERVEAEPLSLEGRRSPSRGQRRSTTEQSSVLERELLNPFTGE